MNGVVGWLTKNVTKALCKFVTVDVDSVMVFVVSASAEWLRIGFIVINLPTRCVYFNLLSFLWGNLKS